MSIVSVSRGLEIPEPFHEKHKLDPNTVGLWQLDGDLLDSGPNGLNLTEVGTLPYQVFGVPGRAAFEASEPTLANHGSHPYDAALNIVGELTIEFMMYLTAFDANSWSISMGVPGSEAEADNYLILIGHNSSGQLIWSPERLNGENVEGESRFTATDRTLTTGQWQHITLRRTAGNAVTFFIDGQVAGVSPVLLAPTGGTNGVFRLGTEGANDIEGYLGSVHILDRAKSDIEILREAQRVLPSWNAQANTIERHTVDADTVGLWQLNGDLTDEGPNGFDLTEVGTVGYLNVTPLEQAADDLSNTNHADRTTPESELTINGELTIMMMVFIPASGTERVFASTYGILFNSASAENYSYVFYMNTANQLQYFAERLSGSPIGPVTATGGSVPTGQWAHIALARDASGNVEFYIDGVSVGSFTLASPTDGSNNIFRIGYNSSGAYDAGSVIVKNARMSSAEILAEANRLVPSWNG